jgi:hypothetical protein
MSKIIKPGEWTRENTGVYTNKKDPRFSVRTYCECGRNCLMAWGVYFGDESISSYYEPTRREATAGALYLMETMQKVEAAHGRAI